MSREREREVAGESVYASETSSLPLRQPRVGVFGYGSRPVGCLPSWGTGRSSGSPVDSDILSHPPETVRSPRPSPASPSFLVFRAFLEGEVLAVSCGFPLPRAVSELRSPGAACSTISPPAVPYTVSPVSTVHTCRLISARPAKRKE